MLASAADAGHELLDGLGLVTRGLEGRDQLEVGHARMIAPSPRNRTRVHGSLVLGGPADDAAAVRSRGSGGVRGRKESYRPGPDGSMAARRPLHGCWPLHGRGRHAPASDRSGRSRARAQEPATMEMEFKDNSRRRTLVLVVGVLLALAAGAAAFMLSSQGRRSRKRPSPREDVVVAAEAIPARATIESLQLAIRPVPVDDTTAVGLHRPGARSSGQVAAIPILQFQPITPNMLARARASGQVQILKADETVAPDSPILRAVSLTVPAERAVGGLVAWASTSTSSRPSPSRSTAAGRPRDRRAAGGRPRDRASRSPFADGLLDQAHVARRRDPRARETAPTSTSCARTCRRPRRSPTPRRRAPQFTMVLRPRRGHAGRRPQHATARPRTRSSPATTSASRRRSTAPEYAQPIAFPSPFPNEPYLSPGARALAQP